MKPLTDVQKEVLLRVCLGYSERQIAEVSYRSHTGVHSAAQRVQDKMCVQNKAGMIAYTCLGHVPTEEELRKLINEL